MFALPSALADAPAYYPARAVVSLDKITANVRRMHEITSNSAGHAPQMLGIVKADGYGHGMVPSAVAQLAGGVTWLGTAQLGEAMRLRQALDSLGALTLNGAKPRILAWIYGADAPLDQAVSNDIDVSVSTLPALDRVAKAATAAGVTARIHLKIDTGMGRGGMTAQGWSDFVDAAARLQAGGAVHIAGIWSHFACADQPDNPANAMQLDNFTTAVSIAERKGVHPDVRHIAASSASLLNPAARFDLIRPGLTAYGLSPAPDIFMPWDMGFQPAMTVQAELFQVKHVPAGQGVSYGLTYSTDKPTYLGLVALGYGDGISRAASGKITVTIDRRVVPQRGRMCMDQFIVDLGDAPAETGATAILFGDPADGPVPTVHDWERWSGLISWEVVSHVGPRVPRVYTGAVAEKYFSSNPLAVL